LDRRYGADWHWGPWCAALQFGLPDEVAEDWREQAATRLATQRHDPGPPLRREHTPGVSEAVSLPPVAGTDLLRLIRRRRTVRRFAGTPMTTEQLSAVLYSGFGVTGSTTSRELGRHPLTTTPSGGARNPYEGYLWVRNVDGLAGGLYHYDGYAQSLTIAGSDDVDLVSLAGGQSWADNAAVCFLLVAYFQRTMWKYRSASAYPIVLVQAGHIVQNMLLVATDLGLGGVMTAAVNRALARRALSLDRLLQQPVYLLALGHPAPRVGETDSTP
jgi:SagB-type dehydrogenase family enzyme